VSYNKEFAFTQEQIDVIKTQIAKGATDDELKMFTTIAQKYGLDPFLKEIWFIKQAKKQKQSNGTWDYKRTKDGAIDYAGADTLIYTSRDGYLKIAQRDENFAGIISFAVREGDTFEIDAENYKVTHKFGLKRGKIIGAWAKVDHKQRKPVIVFVDFAEYNSEKSTTWKQYPTAMIIKVAEVFALKRQFGISGLVTSEEMSHSIPDEPEIEQYPIKQYPIETPQEIPDIPTKAENVITESHTKALYTIATKANVNKENVKKFIKMNFGKESTKDLTMDEYKLLMTELNKAKEKIDKAAS
jgi:phage recombination protein Bet